MHRPLRNRAPGRCKSAAGTPLAHRSTHEVATDAPSYGTSTDLFTAHIRAPHPSGDPDSWDDVLNTARDAVCPNANTYGIQTPDVTAQGAVVAVHCNWRLRYVQVIFQGIQVPYLVGLRPEQASKWMALIDLALGSVTYRSRRDAKASRMPAARATDWTCEPFAWPFPALEPFPLLREVPLSDGR